LSQIFKRLKSHFIIDHRYKPILGENRKHKNTCAVASFLYFISMPLNPITVAFFVKHKETPLVGLWGQDYFT